MSPKDTAHYQRDNIITMEYYRTRRESKRSLMVGEEEADYVNISKCRQKAGALVKAGLRESGVRSLLGVGVRGALQSLNTEPGSSLVSVCQRSIFLSLFLRQSNQCLSLSPLALMPRETPPVNGHRREIQIKQRVIKHLINHAIYNHAI